MSEQGTAAPKGNYESKLSTEPCVYCSTLEEMSTWGQPSGESYLWTNDFIAAVLRNVQTTGSQPQKENAPDVPSRKKHLVLRRRDRKMWPPHFSSEWFSSTVARKQKPMPVSFSSVNFELEGSSQSPGSSWNTRAIKRKGAVNRCPLLFVMAQWRRDMSKHR